MFLKTTLLILKIQVVVFVTDEYIFCWRRLFVIMSSNEEIPKYIKKAAARWGISAETLDALSLKFQYATPGNTHYVPKKSYLTIRKDKLKKK